MTIKPGAEIAKIEYFIENVGAFGIFQKSFMVLLQLQALFICFCYTFMTFAIMRPTLQCHDFGKNMTEKCDILANCTNYTIIPEAGFNSLRMSFPESLVGTECGSNALDPLLSLVSLREIMGGIVFFFAGFLCDLVGRKPMIIIGTTATVFSSFLASVSPKLSMFIVFWMMIAIGDSFKGTAVATLSNESTISRYRLALNFVNTWAFAYPIIALFAFWIRDWRKMLVAAGCLGVPVLLSFIIIPESPRWLMVRRKYGRAAAALNRIAWFNRKKIRYTEDCIRKELEPLQPVAAHHSSNLKTWFHDLKSTRLVLKNRRLMLFLVFLLWHYIFGVAVGVNFVLNAGQLELNPYLSMAFVGLFRIWTPFVVIGLDLYHPKFSRRFYVLGSFVLVVAPMVVCAVLAVAQDSVGKGELYLFLLSVEVVLFLCLIGHFFCP